ncbi:MAG: Uma2 family endonuclease [Acidobacteriota bacterium]|nr:Uma2 family endonuclease [Acidobacteriota bacterium]
MATITGLTIEDFEKLPDELADNHELVDGELIDASGNVGEHNGLRDLLVEILRPLVKQHQIGKVISEQEYNFDGNAHGPDVSFFGTAKLPLFECKRRVQPFVPDLAIEIVSQNDTFISLRKKAKRYRRCGTREVWLLSIEMREAIRYSGEQTVFLDENAALSSEQIPGFSIRLGDLFDQI